MTYKQELVTGNPYLSYIDSKQVKQGMLGTCYIIAVLKAFAHNTPNLIRTLISKSGNIYTIKLYIQDKNNFLQLEPIQLTSEFLVSNDQFISSFASEDISINNIKKQTRSKHLPLWPTLLEKAILKKLNPNSLNLNTGGKAYDVHCMLTGYHPTVQCTS